MRKKYLIFILCVCILTLSLASVPLAADPDPKDKEIEQIFRELQQEEYYYNEEAFNNYVRVAYDKREKQAVEYATNYFMRPRIIYLGESGIENTNFMVAKRILRAFEKESKGHKESIKHLRKIYKDADSTTKGNIIEVLGTMPDTNNSRIVKLLLKEEALDDKTTYEEEPSGGQSWPLRICDAAYNQLVLRLKVKNILRAFGNSHEIETRDYYITILKSRI